MKKFALILLFVALFVASIALVACVVDQDTCEHNWGEWVDSPAATCTEDGEQTRTCTICKKQETQTVDATGHKILDSLGSLKSCVGIDLNSGEKCSLCDELLTGDTLIGAIGHRMLETLKAVAPTCTETGLTEGKACKNCNTVFAKQEIVPSLGHDVVDAAATEATCTEAAYTAGTVCSRCGKYFSGHEEVRKPLGHEFNNASYFTFVECAHECGTYGKLTGGDPFETEFIYDFDESKKEEIDILYQEIKSALDGTNSQVNFEKFVELFEEFDDAVGYVQAQYQFARVLNDITYDNATRAEYTAMSEYYNTMISRYYTLFKEIDESRFADEFWAETGWDEEYIDYVLELAGSYDLDNRNEVDKIIEAYETLLGSIGSTMTKKQRLELFDLYSQLVTANNNIATTAGYNNYMEYAYERIYERDYTPEDVNDMRELVKQYIGPLLENVANAYLEWNTNYDKNGGWQSRASQLFYSQYSSTYLWRDPNSYLNDAERLSMIINSRKNVADYFTFLSKEDDTVDFYGALEGLFESGNFFMGANTNITAYTWYIYSKDTPILVFGGDEEYKDTFTFIHEFGHYYQFVHNGLLSVPMDHDETQSQGNEMLFLAWLRANMPDGVEEGFELLELEQLLDMLGSIVMSTAVDEFEYLVYTGAEVFDGKPIATTQLSDGTKVIDYASLYESILKSYWEDIDKWYNTAYWMYVTFDNAAYYISYAMSALPCIELYAKAGNDGLNAARASYLKLFTFSSDDEFVAEDSFGDLYVTKTYEEILSWAGLSGPFQEQLYESIAEFFENR